MGLLLLPSFKLCNLSARLRELAFACNDSVAQLFVFSLCIFKLGDELLDQGSKFIQFLNHHDLTGTDPSPGILIFETLLFRRSPPGGFLRLRRLCGEFLDGSHDELVGLLFIRHGVARPVVYAAFIVEDDREPSKLAFAVSSQKEVDVVPSVGVELVLNERNAEKELHLSVAHSLFKLENHFARNEITLMYVGLVRLKEVWDVLVGVFPHVGHSVASADGCGGHCCSCDS